VVASFFSGFACILTYLLWWFIGMGFAQVITIPNRFRDKMGFKKEIHSEPIVVTA
jgi:hypothetical protein